MSQSEAAVQTAIRIRAGELGVPLFRNNVGVAESVESGRPIRYGLANDSAQMNKRIKSGDLIGMVLRCGFERGPLIATQPPGNITVTYEYAQPEMVTVGVFLSVECKREDWQGGYPNPIDPAKFNDRERAQQAWIDHIRKHGGVAFFARCVEEFEAGLK